MTRTKKRILIIALIVLGVVGVVVVTGRLLLTWALGTFIGS
jgi:hypothetical protein